MALNDIVSGAVATAKSVTASLQATVTHQAWTGNGVNARPVYAAGIGRPAIVEPNPGLLRTTGGNEIKPAYRLSFLEPISPQGSSGRVEPIDPRDKLVMPDGFTGPIQNLPSITNPATGRPFFSVVALG